MELLLYAVTPVCTAHSAVRALQCHGVVVTVRRRVNRPCDVQQGIEDGLLRAAGTPACSSIESDSNLIRANCGSLKFNRKHPSYSVCSNLTNTRECKSDYLILPS